MSAALPCRAACSCASFTSAALPRNSSSGTHSRLSLPGPGDTLEAAPARNDLHSPLACRSNKTSDQKLAACNATGRQRAWARVSRRCDPRQPAATAAAPTQLSHCPNRRQPALHICAFTHSWQCSSGTCGGPCSACGERRRPWCRWRRSPSWTATVPSCSLPLRLASLDPICAEMSAIAPALPQILMLEQPTHPAAAGLPSVAHRLELSLCESVHQPACPARLPAEAPPSSPLQTASWCARAATERSTRVLQASQAYMMRRWHQSRRHRCRRRCPLLEAPAPAITCLALLQMLLLRPCWLTLRKQFVQNPLLHHNALQVTFQHGGQEHQVPWLSSAGDAELACDVLTG